MLEYFGVEYYCNKDKEGFDGQFMGDMFSFIVALLIAVGAAYLAFMCNRKEKPMMQLLSTLFAFLFSWIYLFYYLVKYVVLGYKC